MRNAPHPLGLLVLICLFFSSCASHAPTDLTSATPACSHTHLRGKARFLSLNMSSLDDKAPLQVGDMVDFWIPGNQEDSFTLRVRDDGCIFAPYVGLVPAKGRTCKELAYAVKKLLEPKYCRHVEVMI